MQVARAYRGADVGSNFCLRIAEVKLKLKRATTQNKATTKSTQRYQMRPVYKKNSN